MKATLPEFTDSYIQEAIRFTSHRPRGVLHLGGSIAAGWWDDKSDVDFFYWESCTGEVHALDDVVISGARFAHVKVRCIHWLTDRFDRSPFITKWIVDRLVPLAGDQELLGNIDSLRRAAEEWIPDRYAMEATRELARARRALQWLRVGSDRAELFAGNFMRVELVRSYLMALHLSHNRCFPYEKWLVTSAKELIGGGDRGSLEAILNRILTCRAGSELESSFDQLLGAMGPSLLAPAATFRSDEKGFVRYLPN